MGAETAILVGSRALCVVSLAAPVEFGRAAWEQRSVPTWPSVWDVPCWKSVPGWLRHAVLGSLHSPGQSLAQGCVLRKQKSLAELQEQISSLVIG